MKKKTIEKVIQAKFDDWVNSIEDPEVQALVKSNTIVTGGCIASMLLKEKINDFDVYFTNKETTKAVASYYVKKLLQLRNHVPEEGVPVPIFVMDGDDPQFHGTGSSSLQEPGRIKIYIKSAGVESSDRGKVYKYFESRPAEETEDFANDVAAGVDELDEKIIDTETKEKYRPVFMSANAITLSNQIQIVVRFYGDPEHIHQHYDYVHCTNYWLSATGKVTLKQNALESLLSKELVYVGSKYPVCSVIRTRKFLKRGWTINAGQYLKMCFQISKLDLENVEVLEDQLIGVDAAYFAQLIDSLKEHAERRKAEGQEFKLDYGYLATIIDKIF
jgi:hypothetical protein